MRVLTFIAAVMTAALLSIIGFHLAIGDTLLFSSDFASLCIYLGAATILIGLVFSLFSFAAGLLPGYKGSRSLFASAILALTCVAAFLAAVAAAVEPALRYIGIRDWLTSVAQGRFWDWLLVPMGLLLAMAVAWIFVVLLRFIDCQPEVAVRLRKLSLVAAGSASLAFVIAVMQWPSASPSLQADPNARHLVLIVIDRMPSWAIQSYNSDAKPTAFDRVLLDQGRVFHNVQTTAPYTNGYFGTLYRGRLRGDPPRANLIKRLVDQEVDVTLMYDHRNALPEGSGARASGYSGLRSRLLGPSSTVVPKFLGLRYHLSLVAPRPNEGLLLRPIWDLLNPGQPGVEVLNEVLLPAVRATARRSQRSFTLFHLSLSRFNSESYRDRSPQLASAETEKLIAAARGNGYRYESTPEAERIVEQYSDLVAADVSDFADKFASFLDELRAEGPARRATVIVTSDHGIIYGKGRLLYGYHPQREVIRVPFMLFGGGAPGHDRRLFGTLDLSHSIADYFGNEKPPMMEGAVSVFSDGASEETATLTQRSDHQEEWFLLIFRKDQVFRINMHPQAPVAIEAMRYDQFKEIRTSMTGDQRRTLMARAQAWAKRFGIDPADTNLAAH